MLGAKQLFCKYAAPLHFSSLGLVGQAKVMQRHAKKCWTLEVCQVVGEQVVALNLFGAQLDPSGALRRPNAKTSGWRFAPRWPQRPWSRCLGEFRRGAEIKFPCANALAKTANCSEDQING